MIIELIRDGDIQPNLGKMFVDGKLLGQTLEDRDRHLESGGGGSGFVSGTNTTNTAGSGTSVANSGDSDYAAGKGNEEQPGYIVIYY